MTRCGTVMVVATILACGGSRAARSALRTTSDRERSASAETAHVPDAIEGRDPDRDESKLIEGLFRAAQTTRGLDLLRAVPVRIQNEGMITRHLAREIDDERLAEAKEMYVALGLLDAETNVRDLLLAVLGEQVVGYYDTQRDFLAVRDDVVRELTEAQGRSIEGAEARAVLIHEIVHALQDQHMHIRDDFEAELDTDATNALQALIEGDASLAMVGYLARTGGVSLRTLTGNSERFARMVAEAPPVLGDELTAAPPIVRVPLLAAYLHGMRFAAELHRARGWQGVNRAFDHVPTSTEQILHPERYRPPDLSPPPPLALPAFEELDEAGYSTVREDTLGELELSVYFGRAMPGDVDARSAEGWDGDRLRIYRKEPGVLAFVWRTRWDTEVDTQEAEAAARRVGAQIVRRSGLEVLIAHGIPESLRGVIASTP